MGTSVLIWRSCIEVLVGRFVNLILDIVFPILLGVGLVLFTVVVLRFLAAVARRAFLLSLSAGCVRFAYWPSCWFSFLMVPIVVSFLVRVTRGKIYRELHLPLSRERNEVKRKFFLRLKKRRLCS